MKTIRIILQTLALCLCFLGGSATAQQGDSLVDWRDGLYRLPYYGECYRYSSSWVPNDPRYSIQGSVYSMQRDTIYGIAVAINSTWFGFYFDTTQIPWGARLYYIDSTGQFCEGETMEKRRLTPRKKLILSDTDSNCIITGNDTTCYVYEFYFSSPFVAYDTVIPCCWGFGAGTKPAAIGPYARRDESYLVYFNNEPWCVDPAYYRANPRDAIETLTVRTISVPVNGLPAVFPIMRPLPADTIPTLDTVQGFRLVTKTSTTAAFTWDNAANYESTQLYVERADGSSRFSVQSDSGSVVITHLETGLYTARIRGRIHHTCQYHDQEVYSEWSSPLAFEITTNSMQQPNTTPLLVAPNPTSGRTTVTAPQPIRQLTITNLQGQKMLRLEPQYPIVQIDTSHWPAEVYLIRADLLDGISTTARLVVQ